MKRILPLTLLTTWLVACSPHPGAGKWSAIGAGESGVESLILSYDGRALFTTTSPRASWHCFWNATGKTQTRLKCTPSSNPDQEVEYLFRVDERGEGSLLRNGVVLGRFRRLEGKPEID